MLINFSTILLLTLLSVSQSKLQQVISIFRHGNRMYEIDFENKQDDGFGGELLSVGMRQQQKLGSIIRQQYINTLHFLSPSYQMTEIQGYSTNYNRTISSLISFFYGLYPPGTGPKIENTRLFHDHLKYGKNRNDDEAALPYFHQVVRTKVNDTLILIDCPRLDQFFQKNFDLIKQDYMEMERKHRPILDKFQKLFNLYQPNLNSTNSIYDYLRINRDIGKPWPSSVTLEDFQEIQFLSHWYFSIRERGNISILANSGIFQRIFHDFEQRMSNPGYQLKWTFLMGHQVHMVPMQLALNLTSTECLVQLEETGKTDALNCRKGGMDFSASIIIQLHSGEEGNYYVKVRDNGAYVYLCNKKEYECDYELFKSLLKPQIADNIQLLCGQKLSGFSLPVISSLISDA